MRKIGKSGKRGEKQRTHEFIIREPVGYHPLLEIFQHHYDLSEVYESQNDESVDVEIDFHTTPCRVSGSDLCLWPDNDVPGYYVMEKSLAQEKLASFAYYLQHERDQGDIHIINGLRTELRNLGKPSPTWCEMIEIMTRVFSQNPIVLRRLQVYLEGVEQKSIEDPTNEQIKLFRTLTIDKMMEAEYIYFCGLYLYVMFGGQFVVTPLYSPIAVVLFGQQSLFLLHLVLPHLGYLFNRTMASANRPHLSFYMSPSRFSTAEGFAQEFWNAWQFHMHYMRRTLETFLDTVCSPNDPNSPFGQLKGSSTEEKRNKCFTFLLFYANTRDLMNQMNLAIDSKKPKAAATATATPATAAAAAAAAADPVVRIESKKFDEKSLKSGNRHEYLPFANFMRLYRDFWSKKGQD